ncbi:MAG: hypothetical protein AAF638_03445 [Pseudomonadota bacterium]
MDVLPAEALALMLGAWVYGLFQSIRRWVHLRDDPRLDGIPSYQRLPAAYALQDTLDHDHPANKAKRQMHVALIAFICAPILLLVLRQTPTP